MDHGLTFFIARTQRGHLRQRFGGRLLHRRRLRRVRLRHAFDSRLLGDGHAGGRLLRRAGFFLGR